MNQNFFTAVESICGAMTLFTAFLTVFFRFRNRWQTEEQRQKTRAYYAEVLTAIDRSNFSDIPIIAIKWVLALKLRLSQKLKEVSDFANHLPESVTIVAHLIFLFAFPCYNFARGRTDIINTFLLTPRPQMLIIVAISAAITSLGVAFELKRRNISVWKAPLVLVFGTAVFSFLAGLALGNIYLVLLLPPEYSVLIMFAFYIPIYFIVDAEFRSDYDPGPPRSIADSFLSAIFDISFFWGAVSFGLTMCAMLLGRYVAPNNYIPATVQMLIVNAFCDSVTITATIVIFELAIKAKQWWAIPLSIIMDILAASILAYMSVFLGLIFTDRQLSIVEVGRVFIGLCPHAAYWEFGPYFWAMHTTFIPTIFYLSVIVLCWIGKWPVLWGTAVLRRAGIDERPHELMSEVFAVITAFLLLLIGCMKYLK